MKGSGKITNCCCCEQVGFSTSLGLLQRNGADIDKFMGILRGSALYAPTFDKKLQRMLDRDYANPNFPTKVCASFCAHIVSSWVLLFVCVPLCTGSFR